MNTQLQKKAFDLKDQLIQWRRDFHMHPELGLNEFRTFGIDRINDMLVQTETFIPDKSLKPKEMFEKTIGVIYSLKEQQEVILSFTPTQGKYIKTLPLHKSQQILIDNETELRISLFIIPNYEFTQQILMLGNTVKVIEPKWLVEEIKTNLISSLKKYE